MKLRYTVHSVTAEQVSVSAKVGGQEVAAQVGGLVVELTAPDEQAITLRLAPPIDIAAATELFKLDADVVLTFERAR